jgi:hypothetical protein
MPNEVDLFGLTPEDLDRALSLHFQGRGQPTYRAQQVREWVFDSLAPDFDAMTNLPRVEREALARAFWMAGPEVADVAESGCSYLQKIGLRSASLPKPGAEWGAPSAPLVLGACDEISPQPRLSSNTGRPSNGLTKRERVASGT